MSDPTVARHADKVLRVANGMDPNSRLLLSESIGGSWRRCVRDYSLDPVRLYPPAVISSSDLRSRQVQHEQLIQIASAEMDSLYDQIAGSGYALLLTDASGVILCERIDPTLKNLFRSAGLIQGADWSELHEGTNGIGTCIMEDRPVTVHRGEHFRARHIGLSCTGAPIHDPGGALLAVLDASTVDAQYTRASQAHTMALVNMSARLIEKCVFLQHHQNATIVRFHSRPELVNLLHDGSLALGSEGNVIAADATAVRSLGAQGRRDLVGRSFNEIFDTSIEEFLSPASLSRQALWPVRDLALGRRFFASMHVGGTVALQSPSSPEPTRTSVHVVPALRPNHALTLNELAGADAQMTRLVNRAKRVARSGLPVMVQGPTGSGKECFARALHAASDRARRPFIAVNCAALPETLIESELFGYGPGAFTGAKKEGKKGKILQSSGGTLFLDEIGDMPLLLQTRLLRVLEEQEVVPLGAETAIKVDLRIICASHRNLRDMIARGEFREDLYYRLNGITLDLPALAARTDKQSLIRRFLAIESGTGRADNIDKEAFQCLVAYGWPGNIRELRNVIRSALAICDNGFIKLQDLPREISGTRFAALTVDASADKNSHSAGVSEAPRVTTPPNRLVAAECDALVEAIRNNRGNMCRAAKQLGISRNTLYRKLKRHGIVASRIEGLSVGKTTGER
jgi:sigma-54 dependent transcriptional regulator, acetoin dehydrogenase operon transcriptional activator AcoR